MAVIYTISHPFTNEIVYVGISNNFKERIKSHTYGRNGTSVTGYIAELKRNYLYPKIEPIDECDANDVFYFEMYWISQLTQWGYKLLNKYKAVKLKKYHVYSTNRSAYCAPEVRVKSDKKWTPEVFELGKQYTIEKSKRAVFVIGFRQYSKKFGFEDRCLSFSECDGSLIGTVINREDKKLKYTHITKSGKRVYYEKKNKPKKEKIIKTPKFRYGYQTAQIGDEFKIDILKWGSFKISLKDYNTRTGKNICIRYKPSDDFKNVIITIVSEQENIIKNVSVPMIFSRPKESARKIANYIRKPNIGKNKMSHEKELSITIRYINGEKLSELAKECSEYKDPNIIYRMVKRVIKKHNLTPQQQEK